MDIRYIIAGFCIPLNIFLILFGIVIKDPFAIVLASLSIGLVLIPILRNRHEKEKQEVDKENEAQRDKRSLP